MLVVAEGREEVLFMVVFPGLHPRIMGLAQHPSMHPARLLTLNTCLLCLNQTSDVRSPFRGPPHGDTIRVLAILACALMT